MNCTELSAPVATTQDAFPLPLPLMAGTVRAGFPSPADDYVEAALDLNELLIEHKEATFFMRVKGQSMEGAGIHEGDLLIVDRAVTPRHGCIVIAAIDGQLTVKRLIQRRGRVALEAASAQFPLISVGEGQELQIWGVVTGSVRRFG